MSENTVPTGNGKSPFRPKAIETYMRKQDETVFPSFLAPRFFAYLWVLGVLFIVGGFLLWTYEVPIHMTGVGVVTAGETWASSDDGAGVVVFITGDRRADFQAGQTLDLVAPTGARWRTTITDVLPEVVSPETARAQFRLDASTGLLVMQPATVLLAALPPDLDAGGLNLGSIYRVDVVIDRERLIAFFPVIGEWFKS